MTDSEAKAFPSEFRDLILNKVDFENAFEALEGYTHFHTESLRGFIRRLQLRTAESWVHFDRAERLAGKDRSSRRGNDQYYFQLRLYRVGTAVIEEGISPEDARLRRRTDQEMLRFTDLEGPITRDHDQARITQIAYYNLIRGDFRVARDALNAVLDNKPEGFEDRDIGLHSGAAAAAYELDDRQEALRHYESAVMGMGMLNTPFRVGLYASRLLVLTDHWGMGSEVRQWRACLDSLPCPKETRECFIERAKFLTKASKVKGRIFIA